MIRFVSWVFHYNDLFQMRTDLSPANAFSGVSRLIVASLILSAVVLTWSPPAGADQTPEQPNIVVIVSDDQGWNDIGYHNSNVKTPHLDRLAENGVRLHQFYAYATCSPTRAAFLTGQNPARHNVYGPLGSGSDIEPTDAHLTNGLQKAGYSTHITGKWHLGETPEHRPLHYGFTTSYGYLRGQIDPYTHRYKFGDHVTWHRNDHFIEEEGHVTDLITNEAVRVIENAAAVGDSPFFLYVAHHAVHSPLNEPPKWIERYRDVHDNIWRRHFDAAVTHMDHEIGRIIDTLERTGQRENTIIVFFSDNGGTKSWNAPDNKYNGRYADHDRLGDNRPLRGWKAGLFEGGIRVPALVNWPGTIEAGWKIEQPTHVLDLVPTLLHLAGAELKSNLDGTNLWPVLSGNANDQALKNRRFYWQQGNQKAVRDGDWKLVQDDKLFNLARDPYEETNLADEKPQKLKQMRQLLKDWPW